MTLLELIPYIYNSGLLVSELRFFLFVYQLHDVILVDAPDRIGRWERARDQRRGCGSEMASGGKKIRRGLGASAARARHFDR